jgi:ornithine carbamoyltransferase
MWLIFGACEMMNLRNRHFLKLLDFAPSELEQLVQASLTLKRLRAAGHERTTLRDLDVALLFEASSRELHWMAQVASASVGLRPHYFGPGQTGLGEDDSLVCGGRQLGRLFGLLFLHGLVQERVEETARLSGVPVFNFGSAEFQPLTVLGDMVTMAEASSKPLDELSVTFLGDGRCNLAQSLMVGASKLGLDLRFCGPKERQPDENLTETCLALASETGAQIRFFTEAELAVKGSDFVYSHSWEVGTKEGLEENIRAFLPYRATSSLLSQSGHSRCKLLHRMPVLLSDETAIGQWAAEQHEVDGLEVSRELFDSAANLCFEQAENQLHCCKAVLTAILS